MQQILFLLLFIVGVLLTIIGLFLIFAKNHGKEASQEIAQIEFKLLNEMDLPENETDTALHKMHISEAESAANGEDEFEKLPLYIGIILSIGGILLMLPLVLKSLQ